MLTKQYFYCTKIPQEFLLQDFYWAKKLLLVCQDKLPQQTVKLNWTEM